MNCRGVRQRERDSIRRRAGVVPVRRDNHSPAASIGAGGNRCESFGTSSNPKLIRAVCRASRRSPSPHNSPLDMPERRQRLRNRDRKRWQGIAVDSNDDYAQDPSAQVLLKRRFWSIKTEALNWCSAPSSNGRSSRSEQRH